ncbi:MULTISPECIES: site-specific DNA-methyltransferase [Serratia]|uniref:site-specific DNA-methyltransferase n=1 Tax=Serratia TaxID=613 RepID=UPI001021C530|nr:MULTISPECIES: site-specific DNA-methyltransferase [Serratia]MBH2991262.1 site-specific DNA-methyltransferase [Serratia ureilytica]MBN5399945.1 site-specific DNA-methyltransferase [Serratia ureilytica]MCB4216804.1 site-specific DNA-methyltransferase [Serratia ureilytica]MXS96635.1 site-specific DNA-methyltransferase [Serratia marcescens]QHJ24692.1 site-specific DNA-methyltransferase [Serratia marcescens]
MEKLKMHSPNLTQDNIARIRDLFPGCVTEAKGEDGSVKLAVDFDLLRQELAESIVEGPQERYHLNWPGKREALLTANAPIAKTLRPVREESVDFDTTKNLFIEGDNLDALKLLQENYLGKVKMIYIDPPYNTGNDFIYEDDFAEETGDYLRRSNQKDEEGNRLVANTATNGRFHSDWLTMMYSRIRLANRLLTDDGVLFVSIDDNEAHNLIAICSEIFGSENFVAQLAVQLNPRGRHLDRFVAKTHEAVLVFVKDGLNGASIQGLEKEGRMVEEYNKKDDKGPYRLLGLRNRNQAFNPTTRPKLYYSLYVNKTTGGVSLSKDEAHQIEVWPDAPNGVKTCWTWGKDKVSKEGGLLCAERTGDEWRVYRKDYLHSDDGEVAKTLVKSLWTDKEITNDYGRKAIKDLFGSSVMDFPKSPELMAKLIRIGSHSDSIVMDFFSGSASTAEAVMAVNAEDGGNRRFIMIQLPEQASADSSASKAGFASIADIGKERIRRAGNRILEGEVNDAWNKDIGFRTLKIDLSNMADVYYTPDALDKAKFDLFVDNIKPERTPEDLLFQVMLDWGVDLALPIAKQSIQGKEVFFVDGNAMAACFDASGSIDEGFVKELAKHQPLRVVFRDAGYKNSAVKINVEQIFKLSSPATEVKCI